LIDFVFFVKLFFVCCLERDYHFKTTTISYYAEEMGQLIAIDVQRVKGIELKASLFKTMDQNGRISFSVRLGYHNGKRYVIQEVGIVFLMPHSLCCC
jgi:hypothetical protein